jgi:hypothetical protein
MQQREQSDKDSCPQSHFTAHFQNDEVIRVIMNSQGENEPGRYRLLSNDKQRITSGDAHNEKL